MNYYQGQMYQSGAPVSNPNQYGVPAQGYTMPVNNSLQPNFICRPVASYEEATATPTDFSGNILVLTDLSHGMIYTKILDPKTGTSVFSAYRQIPLQPQTPAEPGQYAPASEIQRLEREILSLREELEEAKKTSQEKTTARGTKQ